MTTETNAKLAADDRRLFGAIRGVPALWLFTFCVNLLRIVAAIVSIVLAVPKGRLRQEAQM